MSAKALMGLLLAGATVACGDNPVDVVEFEVIEEVEFAASLSVDLSAMTRLDTGVYIEDLYVGTGDTVVVGKVPTVTYTGWLANGTSFGTGTFDFLVGGRQVVTGFEDGIVGMQLSGQRRMIIPPERGYRDQDQLDGSGNVVIPAGSVLIFEVTVDSVGVG